MPTTFDTTRDIPDLTGKVILITGGNAGLGAATIKALAAHNPECIYLCARRRSTSEGVIDTIHEQHPKAKVETLELDLNSFDSVKACAADFARQSDRLDVLFLNAGVSASAPSLTKDGYEHQFGVNHMGHALLTQLLMPTMLATSRREHANVRVVVVSSIGGHRFVPKSGLALGEMKTTAASYNTMTRYGHSKLANMLFTNKLAQVYPSITSTSLHPGTVKSEIWSKAEGAKTLSYILTPVVWATGVSTDEGAKTQLWCATAAIGEGGVESGKFYMPIGKAKEDNKHAGDARLKDELWKWTNNELARHGAPGWPDT